MRDKRAFAAAAWLLVLLAAIGLAWLIPPIQSPDEHSHILRAYMISKGELSIAAPAGMSSGGDVDKGLLVFIDTYLSTIARSANTPPGAEQVARAQALRWGGGERFFPVPGTGYYMPLAYAPHAAALWAARLLDLSIGHSYQLVRIACLLSSVGLLALAWRCLRPPVLAIALLLLPMTLFQLLSPTLDGLTTCLAVLALSLFFNGVLAGSAWGRGRSWLLGACVALLATSRIQLLPLLALPFYVAWKRRSRRDAWPAAAAVLASVLWVAFAMANTVDLRVQRGAGTGQLLLHYAADPAAFLRVIGASVADPELGPFYLRSFIGVLGWLDTWLPLPSYPVLWAGLGLCAMATALGETTSGAGPARALLALAALGSALLVFLALLVTWTPHPAATVAGVQGRYFIVPAIMLAYAIGPTPPGRRLGRPSLALLAVFAAVALHALVATILARYH